MLLAAPGRRLLPVALLLALLAPRPTAAAPSTPDAEPDGALLAWGPSTVPAARLSRRGSTALFLAGAGQFEADRVPLWSSLLDDGGWFGPAPTAACSTGASPLTPADLTARLDEVSADLLFGRLEQSRASLEALVPLLPCLDAFVDRDALYRLRFLKGALEYLDGRPAQARLELSRAALVHTEATFDDSFPPALHDLLVRAKDEVIRRPEVQIVVLYEGADVRLNGHPVPLAGGRGVIALRPGTHLVQAQVGGRTESRVLSLEGVAVQPGTTVLALADAAGLEPALEALLEEGGLDSPSGALAGGLLHAWLASEGLPWLLLVDAGPGQGAEPTILQVDALTAGVSVYDGRPARGDRFTRRARLALSIGYRAQSAPQGSDDGARGYFHWNLGLWLPVSWIARVGITADLSHTRGGYTDADGDSVTCCTLPELAFRTRLEWPSGWFRPYGEAAFVVGWPYVDLTVEEPTGQNHAVWGLEGGVGLLFTPGRHRRVGINVGAAGGLATEIGGWLKVRAGAELRF